MAVQTILCTSVGTYNQWGLGGPDKVTVVDPNHATGFSGSFISSGGAGVAQYQTYYITPPAPRTAITSWVTYIGGGKNANAAQSNFYMWDSVAGTRVYTTCNFNIFIWNYQEFTLTWSSPTDAMIDSPNLQHMVYNYDSDGTHPSYVNYLYSLFTYTPAASTFFVSIWNLVPLLFGGAGLLYREFVEMTKAARIRYSPAELAEGWREYKNGIVIPKYCFLGF